MGGGGLASTASEIGLVRKGGRGRTEAEFVAIFLEGRGGVGVAEDDDREGRTGGAGDIELERLTPAEADVLLGGGRKFVCGLVFRFTALRGGGGGGGACPPYGSQFVFANGTLSI